MSTFDEFYVRWFRAAVACYLAWCEEHDAHEYDDVSAFYGWQGEMRAYVRVCYSLRPYLSDMRVKSLEGSVYKGRFTLGGGDSIIEVRDASATK